MAYSNDGQWHSQVSKPKDKGERALRGGMEHDRKGKPILEKQYGDKPAYGAKKAYGAKPAYGEKKTYGAKPAYGEKKTYGAKPAYGEKKTYGEKPAYGEKKTYGEKPAYGEKKTYGAKPAYGEKKTYGAKPAYGEKKTYGEKPAYGEKKTYGAKPAYGEKRTYGEKPAYGTKPAYGERSAPSYAPTEAKRTNEYAPAVQKPFIPANTPNADVETLPFVVVGRNPVKEAIKSDKSIDKLYVINTGAEDGSLRELVHMAREKNLVISQVTRERLDQISLPYGYGGRPAVHQGIIAQMSEVVYMDVEQIIQIAKAHEDRPPFVMILDSINDPHNMGAIIRSAICAGVDGIIIPKRRSAPISAAVAKASAGAVMHANIARVTNLTAAAKQLKDAGFWLAGAQAGDEAQDMHAAPMSGPLALIIGGEDEGISRLLKEQCDFLVSVPMYGQVNSLNASAASAVLIYEKLRQDGR